MAMRAEVWDVKDRAPVIFPAPSRLGRTTKESYILAYQAMAPNLRARIDRYVETTELILDIQQR